MQILLSNSQAGTSRTVKQEQEEISRNHVQTFISPLCTKMSKINGSKVPLAKKEKVVEILATFENVFLHESL